MNNFIAETAQQIFVSLVAKANEENITNPEYYYELLAEQAITAAKILTEKLKTAGHLTYNSLNRNVKEINDTNT